MAEDNSTNTFESELKETNKLLKNFTSKRHAFYRGILGGLGASLGATIVITVLLWIVSQLEYAPIIGDLAKAVSDFLQGRITIPPARPVVTP